MPPTRRTTSSALWSTRRPAMGSLYPVGYSEPQSVGDARATQQPADGEDDSRHSELPEHPAEQRGDEHRRDEVLRGEHREGHEEEHHPGHGAGEQDTTRADRGVAPERQREVEDRAADDERHHPEQPDGDTASVSTPVTKAASVAMPGTRVTTRARKGSAVCTAATRAYAGGEAAASTLVTGTTARKTRA